MNEKTDELTHDPELIMQVVERIMGHMSAAVRLACVEKERMDCFDCVMSLMSDDVNAFFDKELIPLINTEEIPDGWMALAVKWSRAKTFEVLEKEDCRGIDTSLYIDNSTACH